MLEDTNPVKVLADLDIPGGYPANHFAFQYVLNVLGEMGAQTLLEIGVGHGNALPIFTEAGLRMWGMDNDANCVTASRDRMTQLGLDPTSVVWGDIDDALSYNPLRKEAPFDAVLAMGVLPHVRHERAALRNMRALLKPGGRAFVECRNSLFSLVTFNRYTYEFLMDEVFVDVQGSMRTELDGLLRERLSVDIPTRTEGHQPVFHNPLTVHETFEGAGFIDVSIHPFHYHAAPPMLEAKDRQAFRDGGLALENEPSDWRGLLLCSAFVVQATKPLRPSDGEGGVGEEIVRATGPAVVHPGQACCP